MHEEQLWRKKSRKESENKMYLCGERDEKLFQSRDYITFVCYLKDWSTFVGLGICDAVDSVMSKSGIRLNLVI